MRGYGKTGVVEQIRAAGGEIYAVTSEPQALASRAQAECNFGFEAIGDPHHEISQTCRDRGWLELFVNANAGFLRSSLSFDPQHPKGYFQPGVLAISETGRVLYRWRSIPTRKNTGGATERPSAQHVWSKLSLALDAPADAGDAGFDADPALDSRAIPWPAFVALLVANGWFIQPRGFAYASSGPSPQRRALNALLRIPLFIGAWGAALWWLPPVWVLGAIALWTAWITPRIRRIHEEFQNETVD